MTSKVLRNGAHRAGCSSRPAAFSNILSFVWGTQARRRDASKTFQPQRCGLISMIVIPQRTLCVCLEARSLSNLVIPRTVRGQTADAVCPSLHTPREMSGRTAIRRWLGRTALLIIEDYLRCGFGQFKLRADFLQARSKLFNLLF